MARKHYTDVIGTLGSGGLTNVATTHTFTALTYVNGTAVPTLTAGESFLLSILDASGNVLEVVLVTAWDSGTKAATIVRAREGTTAIAHAGSLNVANGVYPSDLTANRDIRWVAPSGHTVIDEHNDASLDAAWVQLDRTGAVAGNVTWTEDGDSLAVGHAGGDTAANIHAMLRPLSDFGGAFATGDAIYTHLTLDSPAATLYGMAGLLLSTTATASSGNQMALMTYVPDTTGNRYSWGEPWSFASFASGTNVAAGAFPNQYEARFSRVVFLGSNTWRSDVSMNGIHWRKSATFTWAFTPTHVGYMASSWGTSTKFSAAYDTMRRMAGVT